MNPEQIAEKLWEKYNDYTITGQYHVFEAAIKEAIEMHEASKKKCGGYENSPGEGLIVCEHYETCFYFLRRE